MSKPIAPKQGIAFAFPDVCKTPPFATPIPYPNIAQLDQATGVSDVGGKELLVGPNSLPVILLDSMVNTSTGDEGGSAGGGVVSNSVKGPCQVVQASTTVLYGSDGKGIARFMDSTQQNMNGSLFNANGFILSAFPSVLVGD